MVQQKIIGLLLCVISILVAILAGEGVECLFFFFGLYAMTTKERLIK